MDRHLISVSGSWLDSPPGQKTSPEYRVLGRTGLKVTTVGYGAMRTRDPAVIHRALDMGINYLDTARSYMDGYNEVVVGKVLKSRRKDVFVATKISNLGALDTTEKLVESVNKSLKALQTDHIDVIQLHNLKSVSQIKNELYLDALQSVKKAGKARFIGFTTHRNEASLVDAAIPMDFYDVILVKYNFQSPKKLGDLIQKAAAAGIGIVAMKTQAGGYKNHKMQNLSPHQAALRWVLQNSGVATTIPSMTSYGHLDENIQVMQSSFGWSDRKVLYRYAKAIDKQWCRMCDACIGQCPHGVDVFEINRSLMYLDGYRDPHLARKTYSQIPESCLPIRCQACRGCDVRCVHGLDIKPRMLKAGSVLC
jgi:predicted aldo/keto reductase-like oxidoreductase